MLHPPALRLFLPGQLQEQVQAAAELRLCGHVPAQEPLAGGSHGRGVAYCQTALCTQDVRGVHRWGWVSLGFGAGCLLAAWHFGHVGCACVCGLCV